MNLPEALLARASQPDLPAGSSCTCYWVLRTSFCIPIQEAWNWWGEGHQDDVSIWDLAAVTTSSVLLPALPATLGKSFNLFAPPLTQPFERGSVGHNNPDLLYMVVVKNYF